MKPLTDKQAAVLMTLASADGHPLTPTEIGEACGKSYDRASSWAAGALKALARGKLVESPSRGCYRLTAMGKEIAIELEREDV